MQQSQAHIGTVEALKKALFAQQDLNAELLDALQDLVERDRAEAAASGFTDDEMTWLEDARCVIAKATA